MAFDAFIRSAWNDQAGRRLTREVVALRCATGDADALATLPKEDGIAALATVAPARTAQHAFGPHAAGRTRSSFNVPS